MKNQKPYFKAAVKGDTLEMLVYGEIGKNWDGCGVSASDIKKQIDNAGAFDKISLRINSPGGDAFEGIAIHNLIRAQKKPVEVCVDGLAASSASIVAMAGDTITMGSNAMMMIHNAWSVAAGNAAELRKMADTLDKVSASIAQTYVDKTGKTLDEIKSLMDDETWMSAEDCVKMSFATGVTGDNPEAIALAKTFKSLAKMKAVPEQFKNDAMCMCDCNNCQSMNCYDCTNIDCVDSNCVDCPMQRNDADPDKDGDGGIPSEPTAETDLSLYEARLKLMSLPK